jgi:hypothetical protein
VARLLEQPELRRRLAAEGAGRISARRGALAERLGRYTGLLRRRRAPQARRRGRC